ncbi:monofunctional biosynthetic peptidoglycan transglycosylase [Poseidonocella sedimentorum]|uniref:Biosynthetic peptidoglycan transglycosylase n=1 Tax=Poseidonocella sedimentorum TaxID=871652 RepID=A0A1I6ER03_9RHOB|nr:monofunctional biosynthetic peptidoglycan transglycosylase [Poseidonocella sedimentorum]SFR20189.1 monofunctional biosynthetic peptidoglycan transglycosylase [Poseidonocella sedimentorum]
MTGPSKTTKAARAKPPARKRKAAAEAPRRPLRARIRRWVLRCALACAALVAAAVLLFTIVNPPGSIYMASESRRLGGVSHRWVGMEEIAPVMARAAVAAEDANFCLHWGFDMEAIRAVIEAGESRGASTISQQTVKNAYLWQGRSWLRKALEALLTPLVEIAWSKQRILEVYLNLAEFDEGVFGVEAAARAYFKTSAAQLSPMQAARLAAVLPAPKSRSAAEPSAFVRRRAAAIADGAETIRGDGRADCFTAGS